MAFNLFAKYQRQMFVLPCGSGKSRVAATIALLLLELNTSVKRVHLVFPNEVLKKKDEEDFKDLWLLTPGGLKLGYHKDLDFAPQTNSVIIFDEADHYIFSDPAAFMKFTKKSLCICLTATCADDAVAGIERSVLKAMGFRIFEHLCDEYE